MILHRRRPGLSKLFTRVAYTLFLITLPLESSRAASQGSNSLFATQLTPANVEQLRPRGPDAITGLGDWVLGNGVVCAGVADSEHESLLSDRGGVLVDLSHCGRANDQFVVFQPVMNLSRDEIVPIESVRAEIDSTEARIVAEGRLHGVRMETTYAVAPAPSRVLSIRTTLERETEGTAVFLVGDVAIHGTGQLAPFTLDTRGVGSSLGFEHPKAEISSIFEAANALVRADLHILLGSRDLEPGVSYGWRLRDARIQKKDGTEEKLAHLAMNGEHFSIIGTYTDSLLWGGSGKPGLVELANLAWMDLQPGERVSLEREIILGDEATAASITDQLWEKGPRISGNAGAAHASLHVFDNQDQPLTHLESDADGSFSFRVPEGNNGTHRIEMHTRTGARDELTFQLPKGTKELQLAPQSLPPPARLQLPRGEAMRLTFVGLGSTPDPAFGSDRRGFREGERKVRSHTESNHYSLAGVASDATELEIPPGHYRVLASRGPMFSVSVTEVQVKAGETTDLPIIPPKRILEHPGWISADFHVHAAPSEDSGFPVDRRLADFVAMGAQVIVSTEHDHVFDYAPVIESMGLNDEIQSIVGVEITSEFRGPQTPYTAGHSNAFPIELEPQSYRSGAPRSQNRRLGRIAADIHGRPGKPILQLNHPREGTVDEGLGSYLSHLSVVGEAHDPTRPLDSAGNRALIERHEPGGHRDLDFDAIELLNGGSMERYRITRADWFSFLLQGEPRTGTANSDSHKASQMIALPVNYVHYPEDLAEGLRAGSPLDLDALVAAVRAGRLYGSTGPLLEVQLEQRGPGEIFAGSAGTLEILVRAAPWVPVGEIRVFIDGRLSSRHPVPREGVLRVPLRFTRDAFVTVEVEGHAPPYSIYAQVAPGFTPFAFTNAIFVDANEDGRWEAPGLPDEMPATLESPVESP